MTKFSQVLIKQGETISYYAHNWESSRDSTTNLKESYWTAGADITAVVRSQPSAIGEQELGVNEIEYLLILTETVITRLGVIKWKNRYFDIAMIEKVYWDSVLQYYKGHCYERLEFLGD